MPTSPLPIERLTLLSRTAYLSRQYHFAALVHYLQRRCLSDRASYPSRAIALLRFEAAMSLPHESVNFTTNISAQTTDQPPAAHVYEAYRRRAATFGGTSMIEQGHWSAAHESRDWIRIGDTMVETAGPPIKFANGDWIFDVFLPDGRRRIVLKKTEASTAAVADPLSLQEGPAVRQIDTPQMGRAGASEDVRHWEALQHKQSASAMGHIEHCLWTSRSDRIPGYVSAEPYMGNVIPPITTWQEVLSSTRRSYVQYTEARVGYRIWRWQA